MVDSRALQNACVEPLPDNASEYRSWKNAALVSFGDEALTRWLSVAFQVGGEKFVGNSSALFPRLDRWLAGELIKSLKSLPELYFKVRGYVEGCTRKAEAPRGRLFLNMISRRQPSW